MRKDLEKVQTYYAAGAYGDYARTLGQIFRSLSTFDSLATGSLYDAEHEEDFADDYEDEEAPGDSSVAEFNKHGVNHYDSSKGIYYGNDSKLGPLVDANIRSRPMLME